MTCWETILTIYGGLIFLITIIVIYLWCIDIFILLDTPKELHDRTKMNWFGCIFVWLLEFLLNPCIWLAVLVVGFFYWLFTVGRKDC